MPHSARLDQAVAYARIVHAAQVRTGTTLPYLTHALSVAALVAEHTGSEDQVIGALLHDAAEDQGGGARLADIRLRFGEAVAGIVAACSDSLVADADAKAPWKERKLGYIASTPHTLAAPHLVSAADKTHHLQCMLADAQELGLPAFDRFKQGLGGQVWYHREVARALEASGSFACGWPRRLMRRLQAAVQALAEVQQRLAGPAQDCQ